MAIACVVAATAAGCTVPGSSSKSLTPLERWAVRLGWVPESGTSLGAFLDDLTRQAALRTQRAANRALAARDRLGEEYGAQVASEVGCDALGIYVTKGRQPTDAEWWEIEMKAGITPLASPALAFRQELMGSVSDGDSPALTVASLMFNYSCGYISTGKI